MEHTHHFQISMHNFQMMKFQWKLNFKLTVTVNNNFNQFIGELNVALCYFTGCMEKVSH